MEDRYLVVYEMTRIFPSTSTYCKEIKEKNLKPFIQDLLTEGAMNIRVGKKIDFEVDVLIK